jgi:PAS domain S-box-containing protein
MSGVQRARQNRVLQRLIGDVRAVFVPPPYHRASLRRPSHVDLGYLATVWVIGAVLMALGTWVGVELNRDRPDAAILAYLIVIVLLSLMDRFATSAIFSLIAVACLDYFFVEPRHSFAIGSPHDAVVLAAFVVISLAIAIVVRRVHNFGEAEREQARLLDLTQDAVFALDTHRVITFWNRGAEDLYEWKRDDAVGKVAHELLHTVFPASLEKIQETLLRTGRWEDELLHTTRDGKRVAVTSRWSLQTDDRGVPIGILEINTDVTDRKRVQDTLARHQATYLAEAQKLSHTGSFGWNVSTGEIDWSEECFRIFEFDPATKPTAKMVIERVHPDDVALVRRVMSRAAAAKEAFEFEPRLRMPDGLVKHLHVVAHAMPGESPAVQFMGALMDITTRKIAHEALRHSEARYQNLFRAMAISFWEVDWSRSADMLRGLRQAGVVDFRRYFRENPGFVPALMRATRIVDVNDQAVALFGRGSKEELLQSGPLHFWPEESFQAYVDAVLSSIDGEPHFLAETRLCKFDGTVFDVQFTVWYSTENKTTGYFAVIDITPRKQAFSALEHSEQRYRNLFQHMPISLWQVDVRGLMALFEDIAAAGVTDFSAYLDGHPEFFPCVLELLLVEEVNDATVQLLGARDQYDLLGPVGRFWQTRPDTLRRAMESRFRGEQMFQERTQINALDGRAIDVLFTITRTNLGVTLVGLVDLSDLVRTQETLERLQADFAHAARVSTLGELTASIAHEVNQPLAAIVTNGEATVRWLNRGEPNIAQACILAKRIAADARRAGDIIARIRTMAARREPEHVLVSLDDVILEALQFLRYEVQSRGVTVSHEFAAPVPNVMADRTQLQQVIVNLAVNALQATAQADGADRMITVRTAAPDPETLRCSVEDSGPGIRAEHLPRLFETFFTTKDGGLGMGLAICRSIVEAHGGRISADNESPNGGARVWFTLPRADRSPAPLR